MSTRSSGSPGPERTRRRGVSLSGSVSRYDAVLALIPAILLLAVVGATMLGVPVSTALAAGSVLSVAAVADALFLNPPTRGGPAN